MVRPVYRNRILASLPKPDLERLAPHLSPLTFEKGQSLHGEGQLVDTIYFPEVGVCSIVVNLKDGRIVEVGIIGRDGFVGMAGVVGTGRSSHHAFIQLPGSGFSVAAKTLREHYEASSDLRLCIQRGVQAFFAQSAQTAACNRVHELEERLARWLLMCRDRMDSDKLPLTHEFLAGMLGTRRSTVSVAAGMLQKAGLIEYSRGIVNIENRKGLESATCECYGVVHSEYVRLGLL
ncbi:MAG TPA: Crp/Fnr family transcriptional regulator [Acidobacteriaceae bacterium]|nr:Crp/Fnr family transcriptional regulator [Acidobacteriaceae bacterium]